MEEILSVRKKVYEDIHYECELHIEKPVSDVTFFLNNEKVEVMYSNGKIVFLHNGAAEGIFSGLWGFVQISLQIFYEDSEEWFYSEYASVMVRSNLRNRAIDAMLKYIYENQDDVLKSSVTVTGSGKIIDKTYDDFWSQLLLLEEVANTYESSYGYFKANSRCELEAYEVVDRVDKLQYVDAKTVRYITQHPEFLKREATGIYIGRQAYLPSKTMMVQNRMTYDIYENQMVIGFLDRLVKDVRKTRQDIVNLLKALQMEEQEENGYIVSSRLIYLNAVDTLRDFLINIEKMKEKLENLLGCYRGTLKVQNIDCTVLPKPTAIFLSVPQYNKIYTCMRKWFSKSGYQFNREKVIMNFYNAPMIYEAYVLIKLLNQFQDHGYVLADSRNIVYPKQANWLYQNKEYNNTFVLKNEDVTITLYYEPVIYDEDRRDVNGIKLYRNNTTSLSNDTDDERRGHYYVPDYLIKAEIGNKEYYTICDAKYSRQNKVRNKLIPDLSYKYLFSFSVLDHNAEINGLNIFYGIIESEKQSVSFYDREVGNIKVKPFVNMIPLSEEMSYEEQDENMLDILQGVLYS